MKAEWKSILKSTWIKVVLVAIIIIPMAYAGIFLGSMWDPYGKAQDIPVAVVNQDESVDYNESQLHIGNDLVKNLKKNKAMDFHFVKQGEAEKGLQEGTYYMVITIPQDFSSNATTLLEPQPKKMELSYTTNPGTNYIASKMDESAIQKIKESVNESVTSTYAETLFSSVETLSDGLKQAGKGSNELDEGVAQTITGNRTIEENLETLASSTLSFKEGSQSLEMGIQSYTNGASDINDGANQVNTGLQELQTQNKKLTGGMDALNTGSANLANGVNQYTQGVSDLATGLTHLQANNESLNTGVSQVSSGISLAKQGSGQVLNGLNTMSYTLNTMMNEDTKQNLQTLLTSNETLTNTNASVIIALQAKQGAGIASETDLQMLSLLENNNAILAMNSSSINALQSGLINIQNGLNQTGTTSETMGLIQGMNSLNAGIEALDTGFNGSQGVHDGMLNYMDAVDKLQKGSEILNASATDLKQGAKQLQDGTTTMKDSTPALNEGIKQLSDGSNVLQKGTSALVANNGTLLNGASQLTNGSQQIASGAQQLASGSTTLGSGLNSLKEGTKQLTNALHEGAKKSAFIPNKQTTQMLAKPVVVKHEEVSKVESNGKAMAPYMMSVGLYVACMAFTLMYPLLKNNEKTKSGVKLWLSKASVMYALSTLMAIVMVTALTLINGLSPLQFAKTLGIACLISAAFMSMIVFFNITCGKIGAFLVLIFMVFQLGGAAGTYPIETSSTFFQGIHSFMPFTYSVDAFRHTLALGGTILPDVLIFSAMILVFSIGSVLFYHWITSISEEKFAQTKLAQFH